MIYRITKRFLHYPRILILLICFTPSLSFGQGLGIGIAVPATKLHVNGPIRLGVASSTTGSIKFHNTTNANLASIQSGITTSSYSFNLPVAAGGAGTYLSNNGSGTLSWSSLPATVVPTGLIVMYYGSEASIPSGWQLCDGSNGSPDLRNTFVVAATSDNGSFPTTNIEGAGAVETGGAATHNHNWVGTVDGSMTLVPGNDIQAGSGWSVNTAGFPSLIFDGTPSGSGPTLDGGNLPIHYVVAFIIKI